MSDSIATDLYFEAWHRYESSVVSAGMQFPNEESFLVWSAAKAVAETLVGAEAIDRETLNLMTASLNNFVDLGVDDAGAVHDFLSAATRNLRLATRAEVAGAREAHAEATTAFLAFVDLRLRESKNTLEKLQSDTAIAERLNLVLSSSVLDSHYESRAKVEESMANRFRGLGWLLLSGAVVFTLGMLAWMPDSMSLADGVVRVGISTVLFSLPVVAFRTEALHRNDAREYREASLALATLPGFVSSVSDPDASAALVTTIGAQALRRNPHSTDTHSGPGTDTAGVTALIALLTQILSKSK